MLRPTLLPFTQLSRCAKVILIALFVVFNACALLRAQPVNTNLKTNNEHEHGDLSRRIFNVMRMANDQAAEPFFEVKNHALFFDRSPGLFKFVAELFIRAGAKDPFPIQLLAILLFNFGLLAAFLWLLHLFDSELPALAGVAFLVSTPFLVYFSSSIHQDPYNFFFVLSALYCFTRYLRSEENRRWLFAAAGFYFMACLSYWMYYVSTYLLMVALLLRERRLTVRWVFVLGIVPVSAFLFVLAQIFYARGVADGWHRLMDIAAARTGDWRIEGADWYPDRTFVSERAKRTYHLTVDQRVRTAMGFGVPVFVAMVAGCVLLTPKPRWRASLWLLVVLLAGLSWHLGMVQHNVIHRFTGIFGFAAWTLVVATFVHAIAGVIKPRWAQVGVFVLVLPFAVARLDLPLTLTLEYAQNLAKPPKTTADDAKATTAKPKKAKPKKAKPKKAKPKKAKSNEDAHHPAIGKVDQR